jgi:hypothetical protein
MYHNRSLEVFVHNSEIKNYYRETENGIMQKIAPIYKSSDYNNGRAHFLAAEKVVYGIAIDTIYFNVGIILLMCILLYIALYYNLLRKLVILIGRLKFN